MFSVYLWDSEGMTQRNKNIIERIKGRAAGTPYIAGGDWNNTPEELSQEWPDARLVQGEGPTMRQPNSHKVIDFFVPPCPPTGSSRMCGSTMPTRATPRSPVYVDIPTKGCN